jgi:hypothetical protein
MKKPPYPYRIGLIMILLTAVPIGATQLGWYFYGKQVGFDFGMIAGNLFCYIGWIFNVPKRLA